MFKIGEKVVYKHEVCEIKETKIGRGDIEYYVLIPFSDDTLKIVETNKAKTFGELPPEPIYKNKFHKAYKLMMNYIDPAQDDGYFGNHQIKMHPSPTGL